MSNDFQTNFGHVIMTNYDSFSHCHLRDIFFAIHAGAKEIKLRLFKCSLNFVQHRYSQTRAKVSESARTSPRNRHLLLNRRHKNSRSFKAGLNIALFCKYAHFKITFVRKLLNFVQHRHNNMRCKVAEVFKHDIELDTNLKTMTRTQPLDIERDVYK